MEPTKEPRQEPRGEPGRGGGLGLLAYHLPQVVELGWAEGWAALHRVPISLHAEKSQGGSPRTSSLGSNTRHLS